MKTRAERALHLCGEYDRLMGRVKDLTKSIGNALDGCKLAAEGKVDKKGRTITHLTEAYASFLDNQGDYWPERMWLDETEQEEVLAQCSSCGIAHLHVQERKAARKALGIVKRQIRMIGRGATDEKA